jgi:hypothetical protein
MMEMPRLRESVRRIIQLHKDQAGTVAPVTIYKKKGGRTRDVSPALQPVEKAVRKIASAQVTFLNSYVDRHNRSNAKRRDGWMTDLVPNLTEAGRKSTQKLRPDE